MFRCATCDKVVPSGVSAHQLVVKRRRKEYPSRTRPVTRGRRQRGVETIDPGGEGNEIVRELTVCPECAEKYGEE